ncbi:MAG TPA: SDR family oxidoreductase [Micropepsaceae bacterium]|nr:SDR family oxidoreductase [Micropepsaceae bacterium]
MAHGFDITGKAAVITGGATGIGFAIADAFAKRGARIVLAGIDEAEGEAAIRKLSADGARAHFLKCDVADHSGVVHLADEAELRIGPVDVVVNNAGVGGSGPALDAKPEHAAWVMNVNFSGVWNGTTVFGQRMRARGTPSWIVNTASEHALGFQHAGDAVYTASKHAVLGFSDVLRAELPPHVGVSVLCPGLVKSQIWNAGKHRPLGPPSTKQTAFMQAMNAAGMDASIIGEAVVAGLARGDFLIVTHPNSRRAALRRWEEVDAAFQRQAPPSADTGAYDVPSVMSRVRETMLKKPE